MRQRITGKVPIEFTIDVDGEFITIWNTLRNEHVCIDVHHSLVPEAYRKYMAGLMRPGDTLVSIDVPAPLLDWHNHPFWFEGYEK